MMTKVIRELIIIKKNEITSEQMLTWAKKAEVQRAQKAVSDTSEESKAFDRVKKTDKNENGKDSTTIYLAQFSTVARR